MILSSKSIETQFSSWKAQLFMCVFHSLNDHWIYWLSLLLFQRDNKHYSEDWVLGEEEDIEGKHTFNLQEKLESEKFNQSFVLEMEGKGVV